MKIMKLKSFLLSLTAIFVFGSAAFADSPLTSTDFHEAYAGTEAVEKAAGGVLTADLADYLLDAKNPIDVKMAVINRLGWDFNGKKNAALFLQFAMTKNKYKDEKNFLKKAKADELLAYAYLKALDNYFDVKDAAVIAEQALKKNSSSRTFNIIAGLIRSQNAMDSNWCEVYLITDRVRTDAKLKDDIKPEAVAKIYEYMDIYKDECK